ncbi:unnamed protein product [Adineta steineri]|uniref:Uncharacterized protein n=1 Tax=Adineta steineri TaxID=433720 RepID=A0A815T4C1_9BILA|nr:unnamed protein product [Adineta steineri]
MTSFLIQKYANQQNQSINRSYSLDSTNISSSVKTNVPVKEFCTRQNDKEEDNSLSKSRLMTRLRAINWKKCLIPFVIGGLIGAIALATGVTVYVQDHSLVSTLSTSSTSSTSTTSVTTTSTTTTTTTPQVCMNGNVVITFDDLTSGIPTGYNNINWTNASPTTATTNTSGYYTATVSGNKSIFNPGGTPMTMTSANGSLFTLYSIAIAAAWYDNLQLTVVGYSSTVVIANNTYTLQVFTVSYLTFRGYSGLDTVKFSTSGGTKNANVGGSGTQFGMDNICLSFT